MQQVTYGEYTIVYERLKDDVEPIGLATNVDDTLVLVCRPPEAGTLLAILEVQVCWDCRRLQRQDDPSDGCLMCGGELAWADAYHSLDRPDC